MYLKMVPFPLPLLGAKQEFSLVLTLGTWSRLRRYNLTGLWAPRWLGPPAVFSPELPTLSLQQLVNPSSAFPTTVPVPASVSASEFLLQETTTPCISLSVSPIFRVVKHKTLCFPLLWIQEELLIFQSVHLFTC